jgi:hypothetical protein
MIALFLALNSASALPLPEVEASLIAYATKKCDAERVEVNWLGLLAELPGGPDSVFHWAGSPCQSRPALKLTAVENGVPVGVWRFRPSLNVWINVPVAAVNAFVGDLVQFEPGVVLVQDAQGELATEGSWVARVAIEKGEVLTQRKLSLRPDRLKGTRVRIETQYGSLSVSADGKLMEDAFFGKAVRVLNLATRTTQKGRLLTNGRVVLN